MVSKQNFEIFERRPRIIVESSPFRFNRFSDRGTVGKTLLKILSGYFSRHD